MNKKIGIIGEYHDSLTLSSIAPAIEHSNKALGVNVGYQWISTDALEQESYEELLSEFSGIWSPPGSPHKSLTGSLHAIQFAREKKIPLLATCAGYQHVIIEYARNVLGYKNAQHEEYTGNKSDAFIHRLACSLVGTIGKVMVLENTRAGRIYKTNEITGSYFCSFGLNKAYKSVVLQGELQVSGTDVTGSVRIVELMNHPFFIGTVFVPQVNSTFEKPDPLITEFIKQVNDGKDTHPLDNQ